MLGDHQWSRVEPPRPVRSLAGPAFGGVGEPAFGGVGEPAFGGVGEPAFGGVDKPAFGGVEDVVGDAVLFELQPDLGLSTQQLMLTESPVAVDKLLPVGPGPAVGTGQLIGPVRPGSTDDVEVAADQVVGRRDGQRPSRASGNRRRSSVRRLSRSTAAASRASRWATSIRPGVWPWRKNRLTRRASASAALTGRVS